MSMSAAVSRIKKIKGRISKITDSRRISTSQEKIEHEPIVEIQKMKLVTRNRVRAFYKEKKQSIVVID